MSGSAYGLCNEGKAYFEVNIQKIAVASGAILVGLGTNVATLYAVDFALIPIGKWMYPNYLSEGAAPYVMQPDGKGIRISVFWLGLHMLDVVRFVAGAFVGGGTAAFMVHSCHVRIALIASTPVVAIWIFYGIVGGDATSVVSAMVGVLAAAFGGMLVRNRRTRAL